MTNCGALFFAALFKPTEFFRRVIFALTGGGKIKYNLTGNTRGGMNFEPNYPFIKNFYNEAIELFAPILRAKGSFIFMEVT